MMRSRPLGSSGIPISVLGLGCWMFGGSPGDYWGPHDQSAANDLVGRALDAGITYFDTAESYNAGASEEALGRALKGRRSHAVVGTKISPTHLDPEHIYTSCDASLRRLATDYIDLYMVHWAPDPTRAWPDHDQRISDAFGALENLRQVGKVRAIGVSNFGVLQLKEVESTGVVVHGNELSYSLVSRAIESEILPYCKSRSIGVLAYSPLQQGLLTGKYREADDVRPILARTRHFHFKRGEGSRHHGLGAEAEVFAAIDKLADLARDWGTTVSELALAWVLAEPGISSTVVGARDPGQLTDNLRGAERLLDANQRAALTRIFDPVLEKLGNNADYWEDAENRRVR